MRTTRFAVVVTSLLAVAAVGCTDDSLPSAPKRAVTPSATLYTATVSGPSVLGGLGGATISTYAIPYGVNDLGDIVGVSTTDQYAVRWPTGNLVAPATLMPLEVAGPGAEGRDVNSFGQIAGTVGLHAMLWTPSGGGYVTTDIGQQIATQFATAQSSVAYGMSSRGHVVGTYYVGNGIDRCFLWTPTVANATTGTVQDLGDLGGGTCIANEVNTIGQVAGSSTPQPANPGLLHAFVWFGGTMTDLGSGSDFSYGASINNAGEVAGFRAAGLGWNAAIWLPTGPGSWSGSDLGAPNLGGQSGIIQSQALDIDDAGFVVGFTYDPNNVDHGFFWQNGTFTTLPDPASTFTEANALSNLVSNVVIVSGGNIVDPINNGRQALRWAVTLTPVAPASCTPPLIDLITQMQTNGTLRNGEARSLIAKLDAASRQTAQGKTTPARNVLYAFINEVNALVASGRLTTAQAQPLLDGAQCAIAAL